MLTKSPKTSPYVVLAVVLAVHATLGIALLKALRLQPEHASPGVVISTLILLRTHAPPKNAAAFAGAPKRWPGLKNLMEVVKPITIASQTVPTVTIPPEQPEPRIDWSDMAQRAVSSMLSEQRKKFGALSIEPETVGTATPSSGPHHRGETYDTDDGRRILWISDECYQVDPPSIPNVPDHAMIPTTVCHIKPPEALHLGAQDIATLP